MKKNILEIIIIIILIAILTVLMLLFLKVNKTTDKDIIEDNTATMWDNEDNTANVSDDNKEVIEEDTNPENKKIIAEYSTLATIPKFWNQGIIICDDGSIYEFLLDEKEKEYNDADENLQELNELILDNVTEYKGIVNKEDLKKIKEMLPNITNKNLEESDATMADGGTTSCVLWNYDSNEKIILYTSGNRTIRNNNADAKELTNLINKYTIRNNNAIINSKKD